MKCDFTAQELAFLHIAACNRLNSTRNDKRKAEWLELVEKVAAYQTASREYDAGIALMQKSLRTD